LLVQAALGHRAISSTLVFARASAERVRAAVVGYDRAEGLGFLLPPGPKRGRDADAAPCSSFDQLPRDDDRGVVAAVSFRQACSNRLRCVA
jgi:hypothetical protein